MTIEKIIANPFTPGFYTVLLDNNLKLKISAQTIIDLHLTKGKTLNEEETQNLFESFLESSLYSKALRFLSTRQRSSHEIENSLKKFHGDLSRNYAFTKDLNYKELKDNVIQKLKEKNLINDDVFAKNYVDYLSKSSSKSKLAIKQKLYSKGIKSDLAKDLLESIDIESEKAKAFSLAEKKLSLLKKRESNQYKLRAKLYAYLQSKGFDFDTIKAVVDSILASF